MKKAAGLDLAPAVPSSDPIDIRRQQLVTRTIAAPEVARPLRVVRADDAASASLIWAPPATSSQTPTTSSVIARERAEGPATLSGDCEARLLAALSSAALPGEGAAQARLRREHEAAAIIAQLGALDAHHLQRRMRQGRKDDPIVAALARMLEERRTRLLAILERRKRALAATGAVR